MRLRVVLRLLTIQRALVRHGLDDFIRATHLYSPFRFLFYLSPWTWFQRTAGDITSQGGSGTFTSLTVEAEEGRFLVQAITPGYLIVLADNEANMGLLRLEMAQAEALLRGN